MQRTHRLTSLAGVALAALLLGACGADTDETSAPDTSSSTSSEPGTTAESGDSAVSVRVEDPWVKAAEDGMTAAFGTVVNDGDTDVTVVSATSDVAAAMELHETVSADGSMVMQPKEGGFVVPAGGTHELAPGGDHLMVMGLTRPLAPGEDVTFTLELSDGSTHEVAATVKEFDGAHEEYLDTDSHTDSHRDSHRDSDMDTDMDTKTGRE